MISMIETSTSMIFQKTNAIKKTWYLTRAKTKMRWRTKTRTRT